MSATFDSAAAATLYAASTVLSWAQTLALPAIQAAASIKLLNKQNKMYREIRKDQRQLLDAALDNYVDRINSITEDLDDAYPKRPRAAEYVPVDPCKELNGQIDCNMGSMPRADEWATCINRLNNQADIARAVFFDPKWVQNVDLYAMSVGDLLRGRFPINTATSPVSDSVEANAFEARNGPNKYRKARSFGLSRLRMAQTGREELVGEADMMARISPHNRQMDIRDMMQTPAQRIALALTQAQLVQASLQNLFNRDAQKPPYKMAQIAVRLERAINILQHEASKATLVSSHVPNYAAILQPQIMALTQSLGDALTFSPTSKAPASMEAPVDYQPRVHATK